MIIAQLTDLHIGFDGQYAECKNTLRLEQVLSSIEEMRRKPDLFLLTGDLVEQGADWAYNDLKRSLTSLSIPYYFTMGNHDNREAFAQVFPNAEFNDGFLQYSLDDYPLRIIVLDTLQDGRHGGAFCAKRANWFSEELAKFPDRPTLIALHHPPIETGIGWMTTKEDAPWVKRLRDVVSQNANIVQIICGHIHRSMFKPFAHTHVSVSSAIAPQVSLELDRLDPEIPDGRPLLRNGPAGFCLHHWDGGMLTTHHDIAPAGCPVVSFDEKNAFIVKHTLDMTDKK